MTRTGVVRKDNVMNNSSPTAINKQFGYSSLHSHSVANNNYRSYYKNRDYDQLSNTIDDGRWNNKKRNNDNFGFIKSKLMFHQHAPFPNGFLLTPYCTAPDRFLSRSRLLEVKEVPIDLTNGSPWDQLSCSMWKKFVTHRQTEELYIKKMTLWKFLYVHIKSCFPKFGLFLVGSTLTGFGGNGSDVDMCLIVRHSEIDQRRVALSYLTEILKILCRFDFIEKPELIQAKVPILKFRDIKRGLEIDLNCNNSVGIRNTHLMYCYSQMDWRVRPLVIVVKLWAHFHDINDAKQKTISSYSLTLMVIHFLQYGVKPAVLPCLHTRYFGKFTNQVEISKIDILEELDPYCSFNGMSLGQLLLKFFEYYSNFNYSKYAISIRMGTVISIDDCRQVRTVKNDPHQWKYLCIEEPFDLTNTARSVYDPSAFDRILSIFRHTATNLRDTRNLDSIFKPIALT